MRRDTFVGVLSVLALAGMLGSVLATARQGPGRAERDAEAGTTVTRLSDGRWLLLGGQDAAGVPSSAATLWDPASQTAVAMAGRLVHARAGHTATLLPDGRILIVGGRGSAGELVSAVERFDPATETFTTVTIPSSTPRTGHAATLLTDGRVLVVGGRTEEPGRAAPSEVWNLDDGTVTTVGVSESNTAATLLADGRVLLLPSNQSNGAGATTVSVFDPATNTIRSVALPLPGDGGALGVAEQRPANEAVDVPVDGMITLRLSHAAEPDSITEQTIVLSSPRGSVSTRVVPAEGGMLIFVRPLDVLEYETVYSLSVTGVHDARGTVLAAAPLRFTTAKAPVVVDADLESWLPDPASGDWQTHRPPSPWQTLPALHAEPGVTAIAGQVLTLDGRPLSGVTLAIDDDRAFTDRTGRFLLRLPAAAAGHDELAIDGRTASRGGKTYGFFEYGLEVHSGNTTVLPFTIWMPRLDVVHQVKVVSPSVIETVITTPYIPDLELHLPPGTTVRNEEGTVVDEIGITPIPIDRPPFPLAVNVEVPVYFTIQPGGAYVHTTGPGPKGAWLVYPNYGRQHAGKRTQFFHYDAGERGWYVYGLGTVTPNLRQVVPDPTTRIYEFTGAMINSGASPPGTAPPPGDTRCDGDPVDLATGLFVVETTDLDLPDVMPLSLTRTYRSGDPAMRPFGIGANHPYGIFLWSALQYQQVDLVLPDGAWVHYVRTSSGTGFPDAVFETTATPSAFFKSVIRWNGNGWNLTLKDGTVYVFGENAPLQAIRDRYGSQITVAHASGQSGNITRVTAPNGRWIAYTYDAGNRITEARDNGGRRVQYVYDGSGRLSRAIDPNGGVTAYTYDASHRLITITNSRGVAVLTNQYDAGGRVVQQTHADGGVYRFAYDVDAGNRIVQAEVTDPRGTVRRTRFNASGYCTSDTLAFGRPEAQTVTWTRDATSNAILSTTDALNRQTAYTYDGMGNRLSITRMAGTAEAVTTVMTYESRFNQVTSVTDPLGHPLSFAYDASGNVTSAVDALQHVSTHSYRSDGQVLTATDALGNTTRYAYTAGELTAITDPLGRRTTRFVDVVGRTVMRMDPRGSIFRYEFDPLGRVVSTTDPMNVETRPEYDANSNIVLATDGRLNVTRHTYTDMDLLASRIDGLNRTERYEYDLNGNLTRFTDRKGQVTELSYDALNRRAFVGFGASGGGYESTIAYTYDAANRLTQVVDSTAGTITFSYDGLNHLIREVSPQGSVTYTYDNDGRRTSMTVAGQPAVTYEYDDAERLAAIRTGASTIAFAYDAANRRTSATLANGIITSYTHDPASQLVRIAYEKAGALLGDLTYAYDQGSNRVAVGGSWARVTMPPVVGVASYDAANQLTRWAGQTFTYDGNGNVTGDGSSFYTWNARDQLGGVLGPSDASFAYDGLGRRIRKSLAGVSTTYVYDTVNVVQEVSANVTANLVNGLDVDAHFSRSDASGAVSYLTDGLSSHVALADEAGAVSTAYTYEPFGEATSSGRSSANTFQFTGRENDGIGLDYYRARYYDPRSARFLSEDPLGLRGGINLYRYVNDNPTTYLDPFGLETLMCQAPLQSLGGLPSWPRWYGGGGARSGPDVPGNPFYHQFLCVNQNGRLICGGHTRSGGLWSPGTPTHDDDPTNPRVRCRSVSPDNRCLERCLLNAFGSPRPYYGPFGPGVSCQEWADRTLSRCLQACGG